MLTPKLAALLSLLDVHHDRILVLTGAGISAESGIPTFRGEEGYWKIGSRHYYPEELATFTAFHEHPRDVWHWYLYRRSVCHRAEPNLAHHALVELEHAYGDRFQLITQNVDGLHRRAGHNPARIYEIHGNIDYMRCSLDCTTELFPIPDIDVDLDDRLTDEAYAQLMCPHCGKPARPHVLWFDEFYNDSLFFARRSLIAAHRASLCIVVGSSGTTNLPLQIAEIVARQAPIIDINPMENPFSVAARDSHGVVIRASASTAVPELTASLRHHLASA